MVCAQNSGILGLSLCSIKAHQFKQKRLTCHSSHCIITHLLVASGEDCTKAGQHLKPSTLIVGAAPSAGVSAANPARLSHSQTKLGFNYLLTQLPETSRDHLTAATDSLFSRGGGGKNRESLLETGGLGRAQRRSSVE